jgi:predicted small lipoprotein YifL
MNRNAMPGFAALAGIALVALAVTGCGGGGPAPVNPPPSSVHSAVEQAATMNWLAKTNAMWTRDDFTGLDQVTTAAMRTIYMSEESHASLPGNADRQDFRLTGLSITIPCHTGPSNVFVAYGETNVFDLWTAMEPVAMVFERVGGSWKLAAAVDRPDQGWPALCTQGTPSTAPAVLPSASYATVLAQVLTHAMTGVTETSAAVSPFAINDFLAGSGSITAQSATQLRQDRRAAITFTGRFTPAPDPTLALPLANGRGFWMIGFLTQSGTYSAPSGLRAKSWPDGNQVATPRPAVVHHEADTFITTYTAIDPLRSPHANVTLDGFFGWPLTAVAS